MRYESGIGSDVRDKEWGDEVRGGGIGREETKDKFDDSRNT